MDGCSESMDSEHEDSEVENVLSERFETNLSDVNDKPLSPVLMSSNINRKHVLFGRKAIRRKSRIRLTERFENKSTTGELNESKPQLPFSEEDFTLTQTENILNCMDKIEEIQKKREQAYKLVISYKNCDFLFKKPISQAPKKLRDSPSLSGRCIPSECKNYHTNIIEDEEHLDKFVSIDKVPLESQTASGKANISYEKENMDIIMPMEFKNCSGFQTASGKTVSFSELEIQKHARLFEDILIPSQINSAARKNKYHYLHRLAPDVENNVGMEILVSHSKTSIPESIFGCNEKVSLTQQICESGISNTQLLVAAETVLHGLETDMLQNRINLDIQESGDFRGFNNNDILKSDQISNHFINVLSSIQCSMSNKSYSDSGYTQKSSLRVSHLSELRINQDQKNAIQIDKTLGFTCDSDTVISSNNKKLDDSKSVDMSNSNYTDSIIRNQRKQIKTNPQSSEDTLLKPNCVNDVKNKMKFFDDLIGDTESDILGFPTEKYSGFTRPTLPSSSIKTPLGNSEKKTPVNNGVKHKLAYFDEMLGNTEYDCMPVTKKIKLGSSIASARTVKNPVSTAQTDCQNKFKMLDTLIEKAKTSNMSALPGTSFISGFSTASGKSYQLSKNAINKASALFDDLNEDTQQKTERYDTPKRKTSFNSLNSKRSRKLGISSCKPISISSDKINRAKRMFEEEFCDLSPIRPIQNISNMSTPLQTGNYGTPVRTNVPTRSHSETVNASGIVDEEKNYEYKLAEDSIVVFVDHENIWDTDLATELKIERERLEERLRIVIEKQEALSSLESTKFDKKPHPGKLYEQKAKECRIPLATFVNGQTCDETCDLFFITPQNAQNIHFKESTSAVKTEDGATVIPNSNDLIGLKEIERSIKTMLFVEERLIPKDWIRNHYKWIIWKLASYERMFPTLFKGCLNVENIIQQLKYRYDREIDRAERPALRKICEKDDAPQKRMVLCVSDIKRIENSIIELELTDGWYGIRTVIDDPLCNQVQNKKIKIGTKLVISGAELMNCDGCSPLEVTELVFLKINYNSTRRAIWNARLGYQRFPGPFPIQIRTVSPTGGPIGAIEICIARIYPIKYLEKIDGHAVWRNKRSEERSAQAWEIEQTRRMDQIEDKIRKQFLDEKLNVKLKKINAAHDVSQLNDPEVLMEIIENSNDPESIQEKLSSSQKSALVEYRQNSFARKMQEISAIAKEDAKKLKSTQRDVISVLKMLVVDINGSPTTAFSFCVWRPEESHFHILREGSCIKAYNVLPRMNGDLSAGSKTLFRSENQKDQMSDIFKRKLIEISDISDMKFSKNFSEFDTVGLVVRIKVEEKKQEIWLTNVSGRLLLVKIYEGPSTCLLLDKLKRGQPTTVCNLTYKYSKQDYVMASANHFSIFSSYSQFRHLQEGLERFLKMVPKCCDKLLQECDIKIENYMSSNNPGNIL